MEAANREPRGHRPTQKVSRAAKSLEPIAAAMGSVRREGLTEQLVEKLEKLILEGVLQPGDRLPPERDLSEILSVSRASLRGALKALQVMGVLEVRQGSGNYLSVDAKRILEQPARTLVPLPFLSQAELFEVRRAMEGESAFGAATRATDADLQKIRHEFARMSGNTGDASTFGKHDQAFHLAIARASGNRYFVWFLGLANKVLYDALLKRPTKRDLGVSLVEHQLILEAIERRDAEAARNTMLAHVSLNKYYLFDDGAVTQLSFLAYESEGKLADLVDSGTRTAP